MADNRYPNLSSCTGKETVCIETNHVLDSCRDRDCYENVRVFLTDYASEIVDHSGSVRVKDAEICLANISIDPVAFNRGFYSVDIRLYLHLGIECCVGCGKSQEIDGIVVLEKHVILFGGESNIHVFKTTAVSDFCACPSPADVSGAPMATFEVADPVVLGVKIVECPPVKPCCCCSCHDVPERVTERLNGSLVDETPGGRFLVASIGLFSVVRIVRPGQYLVQATEYSVPDKECVESTDDDPCNIFRSMPFPTQEFSPSAFPETARTGERRCGCGRES